MDAFLFLVVIAAILMLPALALLLFDRRLGGPQFLPHLVANIVYVAWAVLHMALNKPYAHGPDVWVLALPSTLTLGFCYLVISPWLSPMVEPDFDRFRKIAGIVYLVAFAVILVSMIASGYK